MPLYYAHAMPIYGKSEEVEQLKWIKKHLGTRVKIINPADYSGKIEKQRDRMGFCYRLIDGCNQVVFTKWRDVITGGVGLEVNYALNKQKKVYELANGKLSAVLKPVEHLNYEETIALYEKHWYHSF